MKELRTAKHQEFHATTMLKECLIQIKLQYNGLGVGSTGLLLCK
jgi:hypothetical protein